jgi:hypothetical protein
MNVEDQIAWGRPLNLSDVGRLLHLSYVAQHGSDLARIYMCGVKQIPLAELSNILWHGGKLTGQLGLQVIGAATCPKTLGQVVSLAGATMRAAGVSAEALDDMRSGNLLRMLIKSPITVACTPQEFVRAANGLRDLPMWIRMDSESLGQMRR